MSRTPAIAIACFLLLIFGGAAGYIYWSTSPAQAAALAPDDPVITASGQQIYVQQCAACHGAQLEGQPNWRERNAEGKLPAPPHDESGHTWHHPEGLLFRLTKFGPAALVAGDYASDMPGYENLLSDEDIVAVLSYIKSTWPAEVRKQHDEINAAAQ